MQCRNKCDVNDDICPDDTIPVVKSTEDPFRVEIPTYLTPTSSQLNVSTFLTLILSPIFMLNMCAQNNRLDEFAKFSIIISSKTKIERKIGTDSKDATQSRAKNRYSANFSQLTRARVAFTSVAVQYSNCRIFIYSGW